MTKQDYDNNVLSLKGTHDYDMLCFIRGQYIESLEAEIAELKAQAIVWHKYPDEKPEPNGYMNRVLLVAYKTDKITAVATCEYFFPMFGIECDEFGFGKLEDGIVITHWAYLPDTPKVEK